DAVAVPQRRQAPDLPPVEVGAAAAVEVLQEEAVAPAGNPGALPGEGEGRDDDVAVGAGADDGGLPLQSGPRARGRTARDVPRRHIVPLSSAWPPAGRKNVMVRPLCWPRPGELPAAPPAPPGPLRKRPRGKGRPSPGRRGPTPRSWHPSSARHQRRRGPRG